MYGPHCMTPSRPDTMFGGIEQTGLLFGLVGASAKGRHAMRPVSASFPLLHTLGDAYLA